MNKLFKIFLLFSLSFAMIFTMIIPVSADESMQLKEIIYLGENEVLERYSLNTEEFKQLEIELFGNNLDDFNELQLRAVGDFPSRTTRSYNSFSVGDVASTAGAIGTILGDGFAPYVTLVALAAKMAGYGTVYTTRIYTQRRTNGVLYVRNEVVFYSNSSRTNRITSWAVNREYSDNGLD